MTTLLLLHGMGCSRAVWRGLVPLVADRWDGPVISPDLPGHGSRARLDSYSYAALATSVAVAVEPTRPVAVLGHSLGGAVGLHLASGDHGPRVTGAVGVGVKVRWSADELAGAAAVAAKPARVFATREEAVDRALKVAGLAGLVAPDSVVADSLVAESEGGTWRTAFDTRALAVGDPEVAAAVSVLRDRGVPVVLAAGEKDPMSPRDHLADLVPDPVVLPSLGHSAHVEDPAALLPLVDALRPSLD